MDFDDRRVFLQLPDFPHTNVLLKKHRTKIDLLSVSRVRGGC